MASIKAEGGGRGYRHHNDSTPAPTKKDPKYVYTAKCRGTTELVRLTVKELGWKLAGLKAPTSCNIIWYGPPLSRNLHTDEDFVALRTMPHARSSKLPGMSQCMVKSEMTRSFRRHERLLGHPSGTFAPFYPKSFVFPSEAAGIQAAFAPPGTGGGGAAGGGSGPGPWAILKPSIGSQGTGILITRASNALEVLYRKPTAAPPTPTTLPAIKPPPPQPGAAPGLDWSHAFVHEHVVQEYIERPLLLDGLKFDLRLYAVVCDVAPLRVYLCREGLARFCTVPYEPPAAAGAGAPPPLPGTIGAVQGHLTNYSYQKDLPNFLYSNDPHGEGSSKRSLSSTLEHLAATHAQFSVGRFWDQAATVVQATLLASQSHLIGAYGALGFPVVSGGLEGGGLRAPPFSCFQVLGIDVMLDADCRLYLLEGNCAPSLNLTIPDPMHKGLKYAVIKSPVDHYVKKTMLTGALKIAEESIDQGKAFDPFADPFVRKWYLDASPPPGGGGRLDQALPWRLYELFLKKAAVNHVRRRLVTCDKGFAQGVVRQLVLLAAERADAMVTNGARRATMKGSAVGKVKLANELVQGMGRKSYTHTEFVLATCEVMYDGLGLTPASLYEILKEVRA